MPTSRRPVAYLLLAVLATVVVVLVGFRVVRDQAVTAAERTDSTVGALTAMLDQETGLRGYLSTGDEEFLEPYHSGGAAYARARAAVAAASAGDEESAQLAADEDSVARVWEQFAESSVASRRAGTPTSVQDALRGKATMDRFRSVNAALRLRLDERRDAQLRTSGLLGALAVLLVAGVLTGVGFQRLQRISARTLSVVEGELAYRAAQREFTELVQAVDDETEAHALVQRHLERRLPGARVTLLTRNNSDNRLRADPGQEAEPWLAGPLAGAEPRSCLAVRLGRAHADGADTDPLLSCGLCRHAPSPASCQPLLVGGNVIGSVLVTREEELGEPERRLVADTVAQAAPVLANLKTLAIAESRATTDMLTGLPNRRAMHDVLTRMASHAGRTATPLAVIAFDLDHFKLVNDRYGHEVGDSALSMVGAVLRETLRDSDFAARLGGEEFLVLAPGSDVEGALVLAERIRAALSAAEVPQLPERLSASFGVAVMPYHAVTGPALLRLADRASYLAKDRGRDRVELADEDAPGDLPHRPAG